MHRKRKERSEDKLKIEERESRGEIKREERETKINKKRKEKADDKKRGKRETKINEKEERESRRYIKRGKSGRR